MSVKELIGSKIIEDPTEKDKLIAALKVSGLRTALWNTHTFLYEIWNGDCGFAEAIHAINTLIHKCDNYLNNYVGNYKGE